MSDNERLITQPPKARYLSIPHEYFAICQRTKEITITRGDRKGEKISTTQTDEVAAALLHFFERWTIWRIKEHKHVEGSEVWLYFAMDQIQEYEFGCAFGTHRLNSAIDLLMELKFLERRTNPNKGYDRTYQYRFMQVAIQDAVNILPPFSNIEEWKIQKRIMQSSKPDNAISIIEEAIPHDPLHDPTDQSTGAEKAPDAPVISWDDIVADLDITKDEIDAAPLDEIIPSAIPVAGEVEIDPVGEYVADMAAPAYDPPKPKRKKPKTPHNLMFEAICFAFGYDWNKITKSKRGQVNIASKELVAADVAIEDVPKLHAYCKRKFEQFGPVALATNWDDYKAERVKEATPTAAPTFTHDPACTACNYGQVADSNGKAAQCQQCVKEKEIA